MSTHTRAYYFSSNRQLLLIILIAGEKIAVDYWSVRDLHSLASALDVFYHNSSSMVFVLC